MRRIAVLSALVLAGGLLGPGTALATQEDGRGDPTDRWIGVEDEFTVVLPNGETLTGDETPMEGEDEIPPVGTRLFVSQALYETEDGATLDDQLGRAHIQCTAQVVPVNFLRRRLRLRHRIPAARHRRRRLRQHEPHPGAVAVRPRGHRRDC
jgi:hypothetical protein